MQKQFYFLIILAFLVMLIGGIFLWSEYSKQAEEWLPAVRFEHQKEQLWKIKALE
jgi:cytochrome b subunit of formate dehydrogenase